MAMTKEAWCTLQDFVGGTATVRLSRLGDAFTIGEAKKFAEFLKKKSEAAVVSYGITMVDNDVTETANDATEGAYDRVYQKLVLNFTDKNDNSSVRFTIPAPGDLAVDKYQEPETDLAEDVKDLIGELTSRVRGDLLYHGGGMVSRSPRKKERKSLKMTGI